MTRSTLSPTPRSTPRRHADRAQSEREALYAVLDAGLVCHLALVVDGSPLVLPTGYGRDGDTLYLHGSSGARSMRDSGGTEVCVAVSLLDGVVYARSVFSHSFNYRSAVVHGRAELVNDEERKRHGLRTLVEHLAPGSWDHARQPNKRELAATSVLALDLGEAAVKVRAEGPGCDELDESANDVWAGVLPVRQVWDAPEPAEFLDPALGVPAHVSGRK
jgi:nitroimidazol reductase NimA-like FMN-containing flavoprotein (pyridoxamine 5'-phosphate oxidase superfamily)